MTQGITPDPTQPVSGTVTANAGTNLNTSALALDATVVTTNTEVGATNETAPASDTATAGLNGRLQRIAQRLTSLIAVFGIGPGTEAAAVRVTLPTDGTGKVNVGTVSGTVTVGSHAVTNAGTFTVQDSEKVADNAGFTDGTTKVQPMGYIYDEVAGTALTENDIGAARMNLNRATVGIIEDGATRGRWATVSAANAVKVDGSAVTQPVSLATLPVTNAGTFLVQENGAATGIVTETAPASDTASSGLNGRLQRIAQRLTSLIAVFNIGAGTEAAAVRVTLPTDGTGKVSAAQSGTWTVQPGNTANTTAWKVDGSAVTQPVSIATMPALVAGSANIGDVDVASLPALPAGTNNIGDVDVASLPPVVVGATTVVSTVTPTIDTAAYASGDNLATAVMTFTGIARANGGTARIVGMTIIDKSTPSGVNVPAPLVLNLFDTTFTPNGAANAAYAPSDAIVATQVASIACGPWDSGTVNSFSGRQGMNYPVKCAGGTTSLFGAVVVRGTPTYGGTTDLIISLLVEQDP